MCKNRLEMSEKMLRKGNVYWITGLSGAGKTTIGKLLYEKIVSKNPIVFVDGDQLREIYGDGLGYNLEDRQKMAMRNARLCAMLSEQGLDVVCCTISMFHSVRRWNRENILNYKEIYLKVPTEVLMQRDQKNLYSSAESKDVMGIDLFFEEPTTSDVIINNSGELTPIEVLNHIVKKLSI